MTVPRLPAYLENCVVEGHNYRRMDGSLGSHTAGDNVLDVDSQYSRHFRSSEPSQTGYDGQSVASQ